MIRNKLVICGIFLLLFMLIIPMCQGLKREKFTEVIWEDIENPEDVLVYEIEFLRNFDPESLKYNEFILGDIIEGMEFQILKFPEKTNSVSLTLKLHSPSGHLIYADYINLKSASLATHSTKFTFNETGLWFLEMDFQLDREGYLEKDDVYILEYNGEEDIIKDDTRLTRIGNKTTEGFMFNKGLLVYSQSEFAQLRAAEATEETAQHQKEMAENYELYILILIFTAIISAISAGISVYNTFISKRQVKISREHIETYTKEEKESRRALFKPKISAKVHFYGPVVANLRIANVGNGSAQRVDISGEALPSKEKFSWITNFLNPGEFQDILLKNIAWKDFIKNYETIEIKIVYFDIYDKKIEDKVIIDVKEIDERSKKTTIVWKEEILNKIHKQLEGIKNSLNQQRK